MRAFLIDAENVNIEQFFSISGFEKDDKFYIIGNTTLKFSTKFAKFLSKIASNFKPNFKEKLKPILRINFNIRIFASKLAQILKHFFIKFALAFKNQLLFLPFWLGIYAWACHSFDGEIFLAHANVCKLKKRLFSSTNFAWV